MKRPKEPKIEECCNSGCNPCIFDVYEKQLGQYKSCMENGENMGGNSNSSMENALSQLEYSQFCTVKNIDECKQHKLLLFKQDESETGTDRAKKVCWNPGQHLLVKYSVEKFSCTRAYTPIKMEPMLEDYDFAIIVKRYENGLVSNYLCDLKVGQWTQWRGPYGHYKVDSDKYNRIVMVAQGTGIAPLFSVINCILNDDNSMTRIILFYCCKCIDTIVLRNELYLLKSYWNFQYVIHLSEKSGQNSLKYKEPISTDRLLTEDIFNLRPFTEKDQFLLCGSNKFMKHYSKCLEEENVTNENIVTF